MAGMRFLVLSLFFFSGASGLVYQIVWVRMLTHVFGTTAMAVGVVLAAFMAGLALGSWRLGRLADRQPQPLRVYAWLELGIGLTALVVHLLLDRITPVYVALYGMTGQSDMMLGAVRFLLAFGLVMIPTFLMGGTLPVLARFFVHRLSKAGAEIGRLYAVNTLGAVAGVLVSGFYLIGAVGIHLTVYLAVAINIALGLLALLLARNPAMRGVSAETGADDAPGVSTVVSADRLSPAAWRLLVIALGLSGLTSFAYEIYWTRSLVFVLGNSTYALTTMLTAFITGIALGGYLARRVVDRVDRVALFGWVQVFIGVSSAVALPLLFGVLEPQAIRLWLSQSSQDVGQFTLVRFAIALLVMLVPATLIGITLPLVARIGMSDVRHTGRRVGLVYAGNTLGNVAGALLPGFVLLNWLGIQGGILLMASLNLLIGFSFLGLRLAQAGHVRWAVPGAALAALLVLAQLPAEFQFPTENEQADHRTLFYRDGPSATTKVTFDPATGDKMMAIDGVVIGGNTFTEYKQLLLAHLPKLLRDDVSRELSIGLGSGILAGESIRHDRVQSVTCVEIEPSVVEGAALFARENHGVLSSPRVDVVVDDVVNFLRTRSDRYQVISADEKTSLEYASNGFSYSAEYYDLLRQHLAPGGILIQWVPTNLPPNQYAMVLKTFTESFPHVLMGFFMPAARPSGYNTILVGSQQPLSLDHARMQRVMTQDREALQGLARYGLTTPEAVMVQFVGRRERIRPAVAGAPINTLDHPRYEFFSPRDYARPGAQRLAGNIDFIAALKRAGTVAIQTDDPSRAVRLERALAAELAYLRGYRASLQPSSAQDIFGPYDAALALAPWNDNLRERIALHYVEIARSQPDPRISNYLMRRARTVRDGSRAGESHGLSAPGPASMPVEQAQ